MAKRKGVILITIDSGRQDCIYGDQVKTPNIDRLREDGVTFTQAFSQTNYTTASMTSIFTSSYLSDHKTYNPYYSFNPLPSHYLQKDLRDKGWETLAFCGIGATSLFFRWFFMGISKQKMFLMKLKGFFLKHFLFIKSIIARVVFLGPIFILMKNLIKNRYYPVRPHAEEIVDKTIQYLKASEKDVFLWLHFFDSHFPYQASPFTWPHYGIDRQIYEGAQELQTKFYGRNKFISVNPDAKTHFKNFPLLYRASLSSIDLALGKLFDHLKAEGIYDDFMVILTSDHGEILFENDYYYGHDDLFEEVIKVPLIIKFPTNIFGGTKHGGIVEHVDIYPTILKQFGYSIQNGLKGSDLFEALSGKEGRVRSFAMSEHSYNFQRSIIDREWHLIEAVSPGQWNYGASRFLGKKLTINKDVLLHRKKRCVGNRANDFPEQIPRLKNALNNILNKDKER